MSGVLYDKTRSAWTNRVPKGTTPLDFKRVRFVVIHYPGSATTFGTSANVAANLRGWQNLHMDERGWRDIAYNVAVDQNGLLWELRGDHTDGATKGYGGVSYSILAVLGNNETPSPKMLATIKRVAESVRAKSSTACKIKGHRDLIQTSCPGDKLHDWVTKGMPVGNSQPANAVTFVAAWANVQAERFGGQPDNSTKRAEQIAAMGASIYGLCELSPTARETLRTKLGGEPKWKRYTHNYLTILFDSTKWNYVSAETVEFGNSAIHGALRVTLARNDKTVDVIIGHVRPTVIASAADKADDITATLKLIRSNVPTLIMGDWNTEKVSQFVGLTKVSPDAKTVGGKAYDSLWEHGLTIKGARWINPGIYSDHLWARALVTIGKRL